MRNLFKVYKKGTRTKLIVNRFHTYVDCLMLPLLILIKKIIYYFDYTVVDVQVYPKISVFLG